MTQHPPVSRALPLATKAGGFDVPALIDLCKRAASQVTLSGGSAWRVERPGARLRALDEFLKDKTSFDFAISIGTPVFTASQALQGWASYQQSLRDSERAQRDSERAQRESDEGRIQAAVDRMMQPFPPQKEENEVIKRGVIKAIQQRILRWDEHATIIAGALAPANPWLSKRRSVAGRASTSTPLRAKSGRRLFTRACAWTTSAC